MLPDGQTVETVILPYRIGDSACISTQVGCLMGCRQPGLPGCTQPDYGEIAAQVLWRTAPPACRGSQQEWYLWDRVNRADTRGALPFPEAVKGSASWLTPCYTVTSGLVPGIWQLAAYGWPLNLVAFCMRLIMRSVISHAH